MATRLNFSSGGTDEWHRGHNDARLDGSTTPGWYPSPMGVNTLGSGVTQDSAGTVAGPTAGIEIDRFEFCSPPLAAAVTISGTITFNLWAVESGMNANAAINCYIDRLSPDGTVQERLIKTARTTEVSSSGATVNNFTGTPASTAFNKGDRIRCVVFIDDAGTMGAGFTVNFRLAGASAGADGDSWVEFTENMTFYQTEPAGSQLFLTDTAGPDVGANIEKEMWTSRGGGVTSIVRDTAAGWTSPLQWTDSAGGTAVEWYSRQLQAFTLSALARVNMRALESNALANASMRCELAVVNNDGSGAVVWGSACGGPGIPSGELGTVETQWDWLLTGNDIAVTDGQRLRLRVFVDDCANQPLVTGHTATMFYAGTSVNASGDAWIKLSQTVTEFAPTPAIPPDLLTARHTPRRRLLQRI